MHTKALAAILLVGLLGGIAALPRGRSLVPTKLRTGQTVPISLAAFGTAAHVDTATHVVDAVFVSEKCGACRSVVAALLRSRRRPLPAHELLFLTDNSWPQLDSLAGAHVHIARVDPATPRAIGLQATPTIVSYDVTSKVALTVQAGIPFVEAAFAPSAR
jgi:hypothetical protein